MMLTKNIRRGFLNYFKEKNHAIITSSPVIPHDDPTLLFINAGMNQFKDVFLGKSLRDYTKATTSQKCVRVGGKHNDLENVGHTKRHLTFFEMLGNFSFGDYFKAEAIKYAWEVSTQILQLDPQRIWPSVFLDDDEAFEIWTQYVPAKKITRMGEKDNFWAMGDTGPCGPCSELYYDRGSKYGSGKNPNEDVTGERYLEFWNLVFMQFNRQADGTMKPLPKPSIDTGAGLERIMSLKMDVDSVFETDVLRSLIAKVENISGKPYQYDSQSSAAFRVIVDHLRCLAFAIADGVQPSNVDRGYVLRKVLRRAVRYGRTLGLEEPFLANILPQLVQEMGEDYPELKVSQTRISEILTNEEEAFIRTLRRGGNILNNIMENAKGQSKIISGDDAFKLKDTYGFPLEEITLLAKDADLTVDIQRYNTLEQEAKERSRSVHKTTHQIASENLFADYVTANGPTEFLGYTQTSAHGKVKALVVNDEFVKEMHTGQEGLVILDKTPFYAEMGGQIGDQGHLVNPYATFGVFECQAPFKGVIAHIGRLERGTLKVDETVTATIDESNRQKIANNHTATHLLHWALHQVLGEHIKQAGSVVDAQRLRFDFSHHKALSQEEIYKIESLINTKIRENKPVKAYEISYDQAQKEKSIKQFFGEKYGSIVRVIDIDYSKELCGGTHTQAVGNIGLFRIAKESSIAAGIRRIEAVTGEEAEQISRQNEQQINSLATALKTQPAKLLERIEKLLEENKELTTQMKLAKKGQLDNLAASLVSQAENIKGISLIAAEQSLSIEEMRVLSDEIMTKLPTGILILAGKSEDKCQLLIRVSDNLVAKGTKANDLIKILAPIIEGTGGGKPNSAQAGGKAPHKIKEALSKARKLFECGDLSPLS
jgi:alanyl-tRNA synthetase